MNDLYIKAVSSGGDVPVLPSGTYTPKNSISGPFDLKWQSVTSNCSTSAGLIKKVSDFGINWDGSALVTIDHTGDLELKFDFNTALGSNAVFGLCYYRPGDYLFDLDFGIRFSAGSLSGQESLHNYFFVDYSGQHLSIKREGTQIKYLVDGVEFRVVDIRNNGPILITCSLFDEVFVENVQVVIP